MPYLEDLDPQQQWMYSHLYGPNAERYTPAPVDDAIESGEELGGQSAYESPSTEVDETGAPLTPSTQLASNSPRTVGPLAPPTAPSSRLQPRDRVALYQKLRPYPGLSKSEKLSRYLADSFETAALPGTGSTFKNAARGMASGLNSYNDVRNTDRAIQAQYAQGVLGQLGNEEEFGRKLMDTESQIAKRDDEGYRARKYGDYLGDRGQYYTKRGVNETVEAGAKDRDSRTRASLAEGTLTRPVPSQGGSYVRGSATDPWKFQAGPNAKIQMAEEANRLIGQLLGPSHDKAAQAALIKDIVDSDDPKSVAKPGSAQAFAIMVATEQDPEKKKALEAQYKTMLSLLPKKVGKASGKADPHADIIQFNTWRYQNQDGTIRWDEFVNAARQGKLEKDTSVKEQVDVRNNDLASRIEKMRPRAKSAGEGGAGGESATTTNTAPASKDPLDVDIDTFINRVKKAEADKKGPTPARGRTY